jgi:hypothetical protein
MPTPVKYFIAVLRGTLPLDVIQPILESHFGPVDFVSKDYPFDQTNYYESEMGQGLVRSLITFTTLRSPEELASLKVLTNQMEQGHFCTPEKQRTANLDVGYLDHNKIVLASVKGLGQKIYLSQGVYADMVARYKNGRYQPFEWSFPDFKDGRYDAEWTVIRKRYLEQLKEQNLPHS